jgi:hypothetical protein
VKWNFFNRSIFHHFVSLRKMKKIESFTKPKKGEKEVEASKLQKSYNITLEKYERKSG